MAENRFVTREHTVQEYIWHMKGVAGDAEAVVLLLESRRVDPSFDIRALPLSDLAALVFECGEAMKESAGLSEALVAMTLQNHKAGG